MPTYLIHARSVHVATTTTPVEYESYVVEARSLDVAAETVFRRARSQMNPGMRLADPSEEEDYSQFDDVAEISMDNIKTLPFRPIAEAYSASDLVIAVVHEGLGKWFGTTAATAEGKDEAIATAIRDAIAGLACVTEAEGSDFASILVEVVDTHLEIYNRNLPALVSPKFQVDLTGVDDDLVSNARGLLTQHTKETDIETSSDPKEALEIEVYHALQSLAVVCEMRDLSFADLCEAARLSLKGDVSPALAI